MTLDDLEMLAREGKAGALELAESDRANADHYHTLVKRFEVAEERVRSVRAHLAKRADRTEQP